MKMRTDRITITPIQLLEAEKISQSVDLSQEELEILANSKRDKDGVGVSQHAHIIAFAWPASMPNHQVFLPTVLF